MRGYWNDWEDTTAAFRKTVSFALETSAIRMSMVISTLDRSKDMIVTGGENVYCGEVEAVIFGHSSGP
jgi:acyl-CoA synthetase (AMP-forming)/AMP-acid ligase II